MKYAFIDKDTKVLKAFGYAETNEDGDIRIDESGDFSLEIGKWQLVKNKWVAYVAVPTILQQIVTLEASITPRRIREALLGNTAFIDATDTQIATLRSAL